MTEIDIPEQAYLLASKAVEEYGLVASSDAYDIASDAVRAAAPLIVAAALERMAATFDGNAQACRNIGTSEFAQGRSDGFDNAAYQLRLRVKELRSEQS